MPSTTREYLDVLATHRGDALVVTTMTAAKVWSLVSPVAHDVNYLPSAMSHASDMALGLALARPSQRVVCVNGDGSLLMNLGSLVTAAHCRASNLVQIMIVNDADATPEQIAALVAQSQKRSAVFDILVNPTEVRITSSKA